MTSVGSDSNFVGCLNMPLVENEIGSPYAIYYCVFSAACVLISVTQLFWVLFSIVPFNLYVVLETSYY